MCALLNLASGNGGANFNTTGWHVNLPSGSIKSWILSTCNYLLKLLEKKVQYLPLSCNGVEENENTKQLKIEFKYSI